MRKLYGPITVALLTLAGCAVPAPETDTSRPGVTVPEAVANLAAPGQDLTTARLQSDGCYWYEHTGKVETTLVPLRSAGGNPICTSNRS